MAKYTSFNHLKSKEKRNKSGYFSTTTHIIMGILNITEDSFYDGGKYIKNENIIKQVQKMLDEGASIIDIGAQSTKPGSKPKTADEEIKILIPTIKLLKKKFTDIYISVDTYWSKTVKKSTLAGADMINDISGGNIDTKMFDVIAELKIPYVLMHMKGTPENMQENPNYKDLLNDILSFFEKKIKLLNNKGVDNIIIDPGFGFGKTINHNFQLLHELSKLKKFDYPILAGISRKSMIYKLLKQKPKDALNGTSIANTIALKNGANILRVHDVKEAMECIKIVNFTKTSNN